MTKRANISLDDLRRIALWKLNRVLNVPPEVLEQLRAVASAKGLSPESELSRSVLQALVACDGVGFPMASAFLKFLRPDVFPIIDVRAYRALTGTRLRYHAYNIDIYLNYVRRVQEIARVTGRQLFEVDEQLYCFDEKHNGAIDS